MKNNATHTIRSEEITIDVRICVALAANRGCEVDLAAPVCRQCSADTHINGDLLGADGTGSVVFHRRFLLLFAKEKDPIGSFVTV